MLLFYTSLASAALSHSSDMEWFTQESEHFRIHYYQDGEVSVQRVLAIAEMVHKELSDYLNWQPLERTEIVLSDEMDPSNGFATPLPYNTMTLYLTAPDEINSLEDHNGWLELLIRHEYLHVLHLDKRSRGPAMLQKLFGRMPLLFPNMFQPTWFIEGLATYVETDHERQIGRGQSSFYEMMMRMEALSGMKP
ncbi:MAG: hypothetical protein GQ470_01595, partial [Gammaproteobacteria bacterium]|nr:hypothetical protein [Gammaproteobacteria bacterium]